MFGLVRRAGGAAGQLQGAAGVIETVCGLLIMVGLFTRLTAFLASGEMAVAFWYIHVVTIASGKGLPAGPIPINNGASMRRVLFCVPLHLLARSRHLEPRRPDETSQVSPLASILSADARAGLIADLRACVGDRCTTAPAQIEQHSHSESWHEPGEPDVVVFPLTTEEVSAVMTPPLVTARLSCRSAPDRRSRGM